MIVVLFKFLFFAISFVSNLLSRVILTGSAYLLVSLIKAFSVPGQATQVLFQYIAEVLKSFLEYIIQLIWEAITSLISSGFDLLYEAFTGSFSATGSAVAGLMEMSKTSMDRLMEDVPEIFEGLAEMATNIVTDLWNNYKDAMSYLVGNS